LRPAAAGAAHGVRLAAPPRVAGRKSRVTAQAGAMPWSS